MEKIGGNSPTIPETMVGNLCSTFSEPQKFPTEFALLQLDPPKGIIVLFRLPIIWWRLELCLCSSISCLIGFTFLTQFSLLPQISRKELQPYQSGYFCFVSVTETITGWYPVSMYSKWMFGVPPRSKFSTAEDLIVSPTCPWILTSYP